MRAVDLIARKRDGHALSRDEIGFVVDGFTHGTVPDYQVSALLMAIVLRGLTREEIAWWTDAMVRSGDRVDLSDVPGFTVGKHSTGGVGDKVSIVLGPVAAACGVIVPKMSGRGLGHTGGTLDKLESIPGFRTDLPVQTFKEVLRAVGVCIIGQTAALVPADKKLYALRDVTATVESVGLIAASVMSKKIAEGSRALVLDVKCGDGAFMRDEEAARGLAEAMVDVGRRSGIRTEALVTAMEAPLGRAVGNGLEIVECVQTLRGDGPPDLGEVVRRLAARMLVVAGMVPDEPEAARRADDALASGRALDTFRRMIEHQGGDPRVIDDPTRLPDAPGRAYVRAPAGGYLAALRAGAIGRASSALGAGRARVEDRVDPGVGVLVHAELGAPVRAGDVVLELHHRDGRGLDAALALCADAVGIADVPPARRGPVLGEVR
jgi:pyrimidine-nucleoside phosphorylase/thymidine phosphorylase